MQTTPCADFDATSQKDTFYNILRYRNPYPSYKHV